MKEVILMVLLAASAAVAQSTVGGRVTFLASGSVYLSVGRDAGMQDSTRVFVLRSQDTIAVLQVFAVSSKSSVCTIVEGKKAVQIGDSIRAVITTSAPPAGAAILKFDSTAEAHVDTSSGKRLFIPAAKEEKLFNIRGRIGLQYDASLFDNAALNSQQPGIIVSLRGNMMDAPVKFDIYGTLRNTGTNNTSPFAPTATNDSRLYRFSLEYDDQSIIIGAGRILPVYASSVGYIDGVSAARRMGSFVSGVALGFQPDASMQGPSAFMKKLLLFTQYQPNDPWNTTASASYARVWSSLGIEGETISSYLSFYSPDGFSLYATSDIGLRRLSGGENQYSPSLSLLVCSANYRFSDIVTGGIALNGSRPVYSLSSNRTIPDSLLDNQLHAGVSFNGNVSLWSGSGIYDSYTVQPAGKGFSAEYSNSCTMFSNNIAMSGLNLRLLYLMDQSSVTTMKGYGINIQRNIFGADLGVRYQQNHSDVLQLNMTNITKTFGVDCSAFLTSQLTLMGSLDLLSGLGSTSKSIFIELSRRF
jgi:hypothetical protein